MQERLNHSLGAIVEGDDLNEAAGKDAARLVGKQYTVQLGGSCTTCALSGLGHLTCPAVRCSVHDRDDGHSINYIEVTK